MTIRDILQQYQITECELREIIKGHKEYGLKWADVPLATELTEELTLLIIDGLKKRDALLQQTGLKIVGKIDLSQFDPKKGKKRMRIKGTDSHSFTKTGERSKKVRDKSEPLTKEEEIEAAYEELEEQRDLERQEWEEKHSYHFSQSGPYKEDPYPIYWTYEEFLEHLEDEEAEKKVSEEKKYKRIAEEAARRKEEAILARINDVRGKMSGEYHIGYNNGANYIIVNEAVSTFPQGYLFLFEKTESSSCLPIGVFDLVEERLFVFDFNQESSYASSDSLLRQNIYITDSKGWIITSFKGKVSLVFRIMQSVNNWRLIGLSSYSLLMLVNSDGECIYVFNRHLHIGDVFNDKAVIEYSNNDLYIIDYNNKLIIRKQGIEKDALSHHYYDRNALHYRTIYQNREILVERSVCVGRMTVLPRKIYDSFDCYVTKNWIVIVGKYDNKYDVYQYKPSTWGARSLLEAVQNHVGQTITIECESIEWVEKKYGFLCKRYPYLKYTNKDQELCVVLENNQVSFPSNCRISIAIVYHYSIFDNRKNRKGWTKKMRERMYDKTYMELEDVYETDCHFICGGNVIYDEKGTVYHRFSSETIFVDSWFEYIAFSTNSQISIYRIIEGSCLNLYLNEEEEYQQPRLISPLFGSITSVFEYEQFEQIVWGIIINSDGLVAVLSSGEEIPIQVSRSIKSWKGESILSVVSKKRSAFLVLVLGSGEYVLIHKNDPIMVSVSSAVYRSDQAPTLLESEKDRYLNIGSEYECFDLENQVFAPVPWIDKVVREEEEIESLYERVYSDGNEGISMLDAFDGDWGSYWNID